MSINSLRAQRTRQAGFDEPFVKPIDPDTLDVTLRALTGRGC